MLLYFLLLLTLSSRISPIETNDYCNTLQERVELLERKIDQLLTVTEKHTIELVTKEKRIKSLESILKEKSNDLEEKRIHPQPPAVNPAENVNWIVDDNNTTSSKDYNHKYAANELIKKSDLKAFPQSSQQWKSLFLQKRAIPGSNPTIAFYSYLANTEKSLSQHHTIIFDVSEINQGNAYNKYNGMFTAPESGLYFFSWTIFASAHSNIFSEIVKNNVIHGNAKVDTDNTRDYDSTTSNVIIEVNQGDVVYIRTHPGVSSYGDIMSIDSFRSSFCGFKLN